MAKLQNTLDAEAHAVKMILKNGTPVIEDCLLELYLFDPVTHKSGVMKLWIADAVSSILYW